MRDPRINFRSPETAALLAFLLPGAGHFYQGRRLKAGIFFFGILSLFFGGMILGDWQPVYSQMVSPAPGDGQMKGGAVYRTSFSIGYAAQVLVGLPAMPAVVQQFRFAKEPGHLLLMTEDMNSGFSGVLQSGMNGRAIPVVGELQLSPTKPGSVKAKGTFSGVLADQTPFSSEIIGNVRLEKQIWGSPRRKIVIDELLGVEIDGTRLHQLNGSVERSFLNYYQAPRDSLELDRLHGKLSHSYDIACVFTWIAGLLNLMAIWDAYEGPAYGYGDEEEEEEDGDDDKAVPTDSP
jgi:hypothetical protein